MENKKIVAKQSQSNEKFPIQILLLIPPNVGQIFLHYIAPVLSVTQMVDISVRMVFVDQRQCD